MSDREQAAYIHADEPYMHPLQDRQDMQLMVDQAAVPVDANGRIADSAISELLGTTAWRRVVFFDRDPDVFDWYYVLYIGEDSSQARNSIASAVTGASDSIRSPAVVVKDAPSEGWDTLNKAVDVQALAKMLWWYSRSGTDASQEFAIHTTMRLYGTGRL